MKKILSALILLSAFLFSFFHINIINVNGYYRKNNTYVQLYERTASDNNVYNNYNYETQILSQIEGGYYIGSTLFCYSGYYQKNNTCIKAPLNSIAYGASDFYCNTGYYQNGDYCKKIPDHSYMIGSTIYCEHGYVLNSLKNSCITFDASCSEVNGGATNIQYQNGQCLCKNGHEWNPTVKSCTPSLVCGEGFVKRDNQCITHTDDCRITYGNNVLGTSNLVNAKSSNCSCAIGYEWNQTRTTCTKQKVFITRSLKIGFIGDDVVLLKQILTKEGLFSGEISPIFDRLTQRGIVNFQIKHGLNTTGSLGPKTKVLINKLISD